MDDTLNVSGHRLGSAEVEHALVQHPSVAESSVVGYPHDVKGLGIFCFVTLKSEIEETYIETTSLIVDAYSMPVGGTEIEKEQAIIDYGADSYLKCMN